MDTGKREMTVLEIIELLDKRENKYGGATGNPRVLKFTVNGNYLGHINSAKLNGWGDGCVTDVELEVETEYPIISPWKEKMNPKKPILRMNVKSPIFVDYEDGHGECKIRKNNWWNCLVCGAVVGERRITAERRKYDIHKKRFCEKCGQKLDWSAVK